MFSFNLIEKKWLPCLMLKKNFEYLSLKEVLTNAPDIQEIVGDSPPITISLHRLLLAVLHRALDAPKNYDEWNEYWQDKSWNKRNKLENYFAEWKHRFDLFDETHPFYQVGSLSEKIKNDSNQGAVIQLYFQAKANATLFEHSNKLSPKPLNPSEVARMLISIQAFDYGGTKTADNGQESASPSPLIGSAVGLIKGNNLFETLMLNLHQYNENEEEPFPFKKENDLPAWERDSETKAGERMPEGYLDILTWQSRRILLKPEVNANGEIIVNRALLMRGYEFPKGSKNKNSKFKEKYFLKDKETMLAFKDDDSKGWISIGFEANKALWRDSPLLLRTIENNNLKLKMLKWINDLIYDANVLDSFQTIPIEFFGLMHNKKNIAKLEFWRQERLVFPLTYFKNAELFNDVKQAIDFAEAIGKVLELSLYQLAWNLLPNISDKEKKDKEKEKKANKLANSFFALSIYWSELEIKFDGLINFLPINNEEAMHKWFKAVVNEAKLSLSKVTESLNFSAIEQKAIVKAEREFAIKKKEILNKNPIYKGYLQEEFGGENYE